MTSAPPTHSAVAPRRVLSTLDGVVLVVGLVVGAGIFRSPPLVAGQVADGWSFLGLWAAGGLVALVGALCYAERLCHVDRRGVASAPPTTREPDRA